MRLRFLSVTAVLAVSLTCSGKNIPEQVGDVNGVPVLEMTVERLPDLNVPRSAHVMAFVDGELTVIGGHSTGFVPTATAEYYRDGSWHLVETLFPHDFGFGVVLPSQEVLVGGGCAETFGVGQTFGVELYSSKTHSVSPLPILDRRRTRSSAARLSDGTLVVAGNWYADDAVSTYSMESGGTTLRVPDQQRSVPLILQTASDNAIILGMNGVRGDTLEAYADRLRGEPLEVPLLRDWSDWSGMDCQQMSQLFIGDESVGGYAWLFPARRKEDGQLGLIKLVGEDFSVLETEQPIPMNGLDGETLYPYPVVLTDRAQGCVWVIRAAHEANRLYVTRVGYAEALRGGKAPVTMFLAELPEDIPVPLDVFATLLPGGRIAVVGGRKLDEYHPYASAFILHTEPMPEKGGSLWWIVLAGVLLAGGVALVWGIRRSRPADDGIPRAVQDDKPAKEVSPATGSDLLSRIIALMEKEELWRQKGLKVSDLATRLGTNATYISACINSQAGKNFPEFIGEYRLGYAQRLMREHPEMLLADVAEESGFSNEQSFFRTFKARTGLTPQEWKAQQ